MNASDLHLLVGAYVLDALEADERDEFEAHLADCDACSIEVVELRETASRLSVLSAEVPPATLRDSVLAGITSTRQLPPLATDDAAAPVTGESVAGEGAADDEPAPAVAMRRPWARRLAMPLAAALLGVLAVSAGAWGLGQRQEADRLAARSDLVASVLTALDATTSSTTIGSGRASLVTSAARDRAVLVAVGLDVPPDDKVYELWRVDASGKAAPAGTHVPSSDGVLAVPIEGSLAGTDAIAVTIEPAGGSKQPTMEPLAAFPLT